MSSLATVSAPRVPLRIMHIVSRYAYGGMEVGVSKVVNGLDRRWFTSSVCSTTRAASDRPPLADHVSLHELNRRPGNDPRFALDLVRLVKKEQPHIVHTHAWGTLCEGLLAAKLAGVPVVIHGEHGTMEVKRHNVWVQRAAWRLARQVVSVSSRLANRMAATVSFPRDRIEVIRNGVDLARFPFPAARAEARAALGLAGQDVVVGTIGRLHPVKDHRGLVRAAAILAQSGSLARIVIAGEGGERDAIAKEIAACGLSDRVHLLGHRSDVARVLSALDIFTLPSLSEGLSNTILEAMAAGLPVVATDVGGADELVVPGVTGLLVPRADPSALAQGLASLASDRSQRVAMGLAARRRAEREFSLAGMVGQYGELYQRVAASSACQGGRA